MNQNIVFARADEKLRSHDASALPVRCLRPVCLHVSHHWGGGTQRWIDDFAEADTAAWHLQLRSRADRNDVGVWLELVDVTDGGILLQWPLDAPIGFTAIHHAGYAAALATVVQIFDVRAVMLSSLIGHALDVLDSGRPTVLVLHDLYPFCPALFGWFGEVCTSCGDARLHACLRHNPLNVFWHHDDVPAWQALRRAWGEGLAAAGVHLVAPSADVHARYLTLLPALTALPWTRISHGLALALTPLQAPPALAQRRLRVLVPGRLNVHKGLEVLRAALPALSEFADLLLLGCGAAGAALASDTIAVVPDYAPAELAAQVDAFAPDCAVLLSIVPESFSYTLSEMWALGVPVLATRSGAFAERIVDGETGFLIDADAHALVGRLRALAAQPEALAAVRAQLAAQPRRGVADMVADYRALLDRTVEGKAVESAAPAVPHGLLVGLHAVAQQRLRDADELAAAATTRAELAAAMRSWYEESARVQRLQVENAALAERVREVEAQRAEVEACRDAILRSTSWRMTAPLRRTLDALGKSSSPARGSGTQATVMEIPPVAHSEVVLGFVGGNPAAAEWVAAQALGENLSYRDAGGERRRIVMGGKALLPELAVAVIGCRGQLQESGIEAGTLYFAGLANSAGCAPHPAVDVQLVVPTPALVAQVEKLFPGAQVQVRPWPVQGELTAAPGSAGERTRLRRSLFAADAVAIVLGIGSGDAYGNLATFARYADALAAQRTGTICVWVGGRDVSCVDESGEEADADAGGATVADAIVRAAVAQRRLFVIDDAEFRPWLAAADAYVACGPAGVFDFGAAAALAQGVPVVVCVANGLAPEVPGATRVDDEAALLAWLDEVLDRAER